MAVGNRHRVLAPATEELGSPAERTHFAVEEVGMQTVVAAGILLVHMSCELHRFGIQFLEVE